MLPNVQYLILQNENETFVSANLRQLDPVPVAYSDFNFEGGGSKIF